MSKFGINEPISRETQEFFINADRQEIRQIKAKIELAEVDLEKLEDSLEMAQQRLASREKQLAKEIA